MILCIPYQRYVPKEFSCMSTPIIAMIYLIKLRAPVGFLQGECALFSREVGQSDSISAIVTK